MSFRADEYSKALLLFQRVQLNVCFTLIQGKRCIEGDGLEAPQKSLFYVVVHFHFTVTEHWHSASTDEADNNSKITEHLLFHARVLEKKTFCHVYL